MTHTVECELPAEADGGEEDVLLLVEGVEHDHLAGQVLGEGVGAEVEAEPGEPQVQHQAEVVQQVALCRQVDHVPVSDHVKKDSGHKMFGPLDFSSNIFFWSQLRYTVCTLGRLNFCKLLTRSKLELENDCLVYGTPPRGVDQKNLLLYITN